MSRFIILDFETTGFDPSASDIIEIGAVRVEGLEDRGRYSTFVRPDEPIPPFIRSLTGITDEDVANAPKLRDVVPELLEFLGDLPIVAHNATMERRFLEQRVAPLAPSPRGFELHNSIEPLALIHPESPSHSMETMRGLAGLSSEGAHRALQDCEDLLEILKHARAWAGRERPGLEATIGRFLGKDSGWWWHWYFEGMGGGHAGPGAGSGLGDLRELRSEDAGREIDWSRAVESDEIVSALHGGTDGFERREGQEKMALEVAAALSSGERVAIEAPTGTGKSVAYLLPGALAAERTGAPLVVATRSKALQDQLLAKDIPRVAGLLGRAALRASVVKGQENYFCLRKLHEAAEYAAAEPAGEAFDAGEADPVDLGRLAVEHRDADVAEDLADFVLAAGLVIVVAEHGDDGDLHGRGELARQDARLVGKAVVGEVTAEHQDVCVARDLGEQRLKRALRVPRDVQIADRGHSQVRPV